MSPDVLKAIQALHRLGSNPDQGRTLTQILQGTADAVASLLPADRVSVIELDTAHERVGQFVRGGPGRDAIVTTVGFSELRDGLSGWVLANGTPALSPRGVPDPRESPEARHRRLATGCGAIIVVPLVLDGTLLGTMTAINRSEDPDFTEEDVDVMGLFANYCSVVISNTKLILELRHAKGIVEVANDALKRQLETKDKLFTILAHDLRGPIGNLCMLFDVITGQISSDPGHRGALQEGRRSAHRTYDLLENLLGWARGQMEGLEGLQSRVSVVSALNNVKAWLEPQASAKRIKLTVEAPPNLSVWVDERMLETVVRNLVSNAVKYSPAGSAVEIRGRSEDGSTVIEVADHGEGIPPEKVEHLFASRRVESRPGTEGERGTGLGLMFCADLTASMGGQLEVSSQMRVGSTFRLLLPDRIDADL